MPESSGHVCAICGSTRTERLTGKEFIGFRTAWDEDEECGWTYLRCLACGTVTLFWLRLVVFWDMSQMQSRMDELAKLSLFNAEDPNQAGENE